MKSVFPRAGLACAVLAHLLPALAADAPPSFKVEERQIQALGIRVAPLSSTAESVTGTFPAQVVVSPDREQVVSSPIAGVILQLLVQVETRVRQGTGLLRLAGPELGQQQLQLLQAASRRTLAGQAARREKALFDEGIIPQRRVQESQAALKEAEASMAQARAALRLSGMTAGTIERIASTGKLEESVTLTAPRSGLVARVEAKPGQRVEPAAPLMLIVEADSFSLDIQVPAAETRRWTPGARLKVQGRDATARIVSAGSMVSPGSQTLLIRAVVETKGAALRAGEMVAVEMPGAAGAGWDLPLAAIAYEAGHAFVFVRTAEGFEARPVTVTPSGAQRVRIAGPLKSGEQVAVSGVVALKGAWAEEKEKAGK